MAGAGHPTPRTAHHHTPTQQGAPVTQPQLGMGHAVHVHAARSVLRVRNTARPRPRTGGPIDSPSRKHTAMHARTAVSIDELTGTHQRAARQFFSGHASPEFLIPHLADFYTWTVQARLPLTVVSYLRYTSDHPGTLPDDEQTGRRFTDAQPSGDLDYHYHLTLNEDQHGLRLRIHDLSTQQVPGGTGEPIETLTQA